MSTRVTGLISGIDTESIISQLVQVKQDKIDTQTKAQTKLSWKQDAWKDLNTKLKNLQQKYISNMRFSTSYTKKTTTVSNSSAVSVITGENAVDGVQDLSVDRLAKTGYLTGAVVKSDDGSSLTATDSLEKLGFSGEGSFTITAGGTSVNVDVTKDTTISDVLTQLKNAGLNASFDEKQQRLFVSSKKSGADNDFSITANDDNGAAALDALGLTKDAGATKVEGQNAQITLNGAVFTSTDNVFEINGLTFTALSETNGQNVTVTTKQDTDGIYDMIKNFLTEYNSVINEMDKLYNADSASGYEPLTDDEKSSMSDSEIEKYETKIKDALLRKDDNLSSISSALKETMSSGITVNGKTMYLFDFGIETLGYFTAADNEKNAYHIDGDPDDDDTSSNADKLKSMIATDPDTVVSFFTQLSQNLYSKMSDLSSSVDGYRSYGSFYDDKKMKSDYEDYTTKISEMEDKMNDYEDKLYSKYSAMETALAKMQSNSSAVTSLLGG